jgi:hypothetical protein
MGNSDEEWATLIGGFLAIFAYLALFAAVVYGYIWNLITLFSNMDTISGIEAAVRSLGILVFPAGAIMGYF